MYRRQEFSLCARWQWTRLLVTTVANVLRNAALRSPPLLSPPSKPRIQQTDLLSLPNQVISLVSKLQQQHYFPSLFVLFTLNYQRSNHIINYKNSSLLAHPNNLSQKCIQSLASFNAIIIHNKTTFTTWTNLWNQEVQCRIHKDSPIITTLSRINPVPSIGIYSLKVFKPLGISQYFNSKKCIH